jgi:hypothetical protein
MLELFSFGFGDIDAAVLNGMVRPFPSLLGVADKEGETRSWKSQQSVSMSGRSGSMPSVSIDRAP